MVFHKILLKKNKDYYDELNDKLYELNGYSLQYYKNVNTSYHKTKELIIESFNKINELIEKCTNITFKTMLDKYIEIKNNYNSIDDININEDELELINNYKEEIDKKNYNVKSKINNYITNNEIKLDIILEEGDIKKPKIVGTFINKNKPKNWEIDIYSNYGQKCGKFGRRINAEINDISLSVDFNFDGGSNKASFNSKTDFDAYAIKNYFYETKEIKQSKKIGNIEFPLPSRCDEIDAGIPEGEKEEEIIDAKKNESNIAYNF